MYRRDARQTTTNTPVTSTAALDKLDTMVSSVSSVAGESVPEDAPSGSHEPFSLKFGDRGAEKLSAELEQRAVAEAELLVTADGTICGDRLALLQHTYEASFVMRVLSRAPSSALLELPEVNGDAVNTAILLDDFREIRQWHDAPATTRSVFPDLTVSVFDEGVDFQQILDRQRRLVSEKFLSEHPKLVSNSSQSGELQMVGLSHFQSLLRSFSHGLLEGVPLHRDRLILGGSAMPWCVRGLTSKQRALCEMEERATVFERKLLAHLSKRVGRECSRRILIMAGDEQNAKKVSSALRAGSLRSSLRKQLNTDGWQDADIDLFVVGDGAEETVRQTISVVQSNVRTCGEDRTSVVLRTRNTLTVVGGFPLPHVQVVCKTVRSAQELLVHCDVDCSALAYDGERVLAAPRAFRALASGFNFIPKQLFTHKSPRSIRSVARFDKYYRRGFSVVVFEHCRHVPRCDHNLAGISLKAVFDNVRGLTKVKEPKLRGGPQEKGKILSEWMCKLVPELRQKVTKTGEDQEIKREYDVAAAVPAATTVHGSGVDVQRHRVVPGDRRDEDPGNERVGGDSRRDGPFRRYRGVRDIVIPSGPDVCSETLKEYVMSLGRPELLEVATTSVVTLAPKTDSDRKQWQDRLRGKCYMCKEAVKTREPWPMCPTCAALNQRKREEMTDCSGKVAIVTGGRTKIGRECGLRLLRAGATVVVTSRFPRNALERYKLEEDFASFSARLVVLRADFRHLSSVQGLVSAVLERFARVDILIHNAAQTVRRPPVYYESLLKREEELSQQSNSQDEACESISAAGLVEEAMALLPASLCLPVLTSDLEAEAKKHEWFPSGRTDAHGEQLDLRAFTSWTLKLEDTEMSELVEVLSVNLVVPYVLTARWLSLLRAGAPSFVVFVSSMEGSFSTPGAKNSTHPHTNVAKAGLNMLARTIAGELRRDAVFASAVDPGWVSWMMPGGSQERETAPLSEADGAARVLDPVFSGLRALHSSRSPPTGVLFKDFKVVPW